jgi:hypothetical protein
MDNRDRDEHDPEDGDTAGGQGEVLAQPVDPVEALDAGRRQAAAYVGEAVRALVQVVQGRAGRNAMARMLGAQALLKFVAEAGPQPVGEVDALIKRLMGDRKQLVAELDKRKGWQ